MQTLRLFRFAVLLVLACTVGCGPVFVVHKETTKMQGIPFYVKTAHCLHKSVYLMPYYRIILELLTEDGKNIDETEVAAISAQDYATPKVQEILKTLRQKQRPAYRNDLDYLLSLSKDPYQRAEYESDQQPQCEKQQQPVCEKALREKCPGDQGPECKNALAECDKTQCVPWPKHLVANTAASVVLVDYANTYTLNVRKPLIGSVNADYTLSPEGTLSKASAQVQEQTVSTFLSLLPISELIKTVAKVGVGRSPEIPLKVRIEARAIKITRSKFEGETAATCETCGNEVKENFDLLIEDVGTGEAKPSSEDDKSFKISGTVTPPKAPQEGATPAGSGSGASPAPSGTPPKSPTSAPSGKGTWKPR